MTPKPILRATLGILTLFALHLSVLAEDAKKHPASTEAIANTPAVLWQNPTDIATRDLYYGPGGKEHAPHTTYTFVKEDLNGTNPKFDVQDENGTKWKVKMGVEARPEVVATRLVWAVGYYANEDYFVPEMRVENMPHLQRGQNQVGPDGTVHNVRLKRALKDEKDIGTWKWRDNPFAGRRDFNGLRVLMAVLNSWDLKDTNTAVYEQKDDDQGQDGTPAELHYEISDLGATFGTSGESWTHSASKGNLKSYSHSKFIRKATPEYVDFYTPARPAFIFIFTPRMYFTRVHMEWIGKRVPRADAKWMGDLLAQLSPEQIRDAFRAAGYTPDQVEAFASVVQQRIAELEAL